MATARRLVQVVTPTGTEDDPTFRLVAQFKSVPEAIEMIGTGKLGDGPFDIVTLNRRGLKRIRREVFDIDEGEAFGGRGSDTGANEGANGGGAMDGSDDETQPAA